MDWFLFINPIGGGITWRGKTSTIGGRRYEVFKEPIWEGWRFVPYWRFRVSGTPHPSFYKTLRQAKAAAEFHATRRGARVA